VIQAGARVVQGHDPAHVAGSRAVIYTAAVPAAHPELAAARAAGIPVVPRAEALQALCRGTVLAVAGTHGKTTTTAMATEVLAAAGRHPTGIAGGRVAAWGGNARVDGDQLFVVEADEYAKSFLALQPEVAVVTNVEADHLECYGSLAALEDAFVEFAGRARLVLVGADDAGAERVARRLRVPVWRVGLGATADIAIRDVRPDRTGSSARLRLADGIGVDLRLGVPGLHNVRNAAMALGAAVALGAAPAAGLAALAAFGGVGRRFERLGAARGVTVVDDYAHHPSEVSATIAAARERFPGHRLVAVFQPHLYSRTQALGAELGRSLAAADVAVVTEIYPAREQPIAGVSGTAVAAAARAGGTRVEWVADRRALAARLTDLVADGDVVLTLGAGDITEVGPELLRRLTGAAA
jgi:UDP-N-acetylmuramate--alanine ligase